MFSRLAETRWIRFDRHKACSFKWLGVCVLTTAKRVKVSHTFVGSVYTIVKACKKVTEARRIPFDHYKACRKLAQARRVGFDN